MIIGESLVFIQLAADHALLTQQYAINIIIVLNIIIISYLVVRLSNFVYVTRCVCSLYFLPLLLH